MRLAATLQSERWAMPINFSYSLKIGTKGSIAKWLGSLGTPDPLLGRIALSPEPNRVISDSSLF